LHDILKVFPKAILLFTVSYGVKLMKKLLNTFLMLNFLEVKMCKFLFAAKKIPSSVPLATAPLVLVGSFGTADWAVQPPGRQSV
jgi:hypothetical protein